MTPMIDVVFQLIVFFLVSMKFKTLDELIETPFRAGGPRQHAPEIPPLHVALRAADRSAPVRLVVNGVEFGTVDGSRSGPAWSRFAEHVARVRRSAAELRAPPPRAEIDASPAVASGRVVAALDVLAGAGVTDVRFQGTKPPR